MRLAVLAILCAVLAIPQRVGAQAPVAQQAASASGIAELYGMLQAIDPYRPSSEVSGEIRVVGSTAMDTVAHMWAAGFNKFHKNVKVVITAAGSADALKQMVNDRKVVAMLSRPVKDEEIDELKKAGVQQPTRFIVAREALGVWVHSSNPLPSISFEQLRGIFTKEGASELPKWSALGVSGELANKPIKIVLRPETSGTHAFLKEFVFAGTEMREGGQIQQSNAEVLSAVSADPDAITVCGLRATGKSVRSVPLESGGKPVASDDHAVLSGQYPLTRYLTLIVDMSQKDAQAKASQELVHYALCQTAQLDAIRAGFFPAELPKLRAGLDQLQGNQLR